MDLALKDSASPASSDDELGVPLELGELTSRRPSRAARDAYGGAAWSTMVVKLLEDAVGEELRAPGFPARLV